MDVSLVHSRLPSAFLTGCPNAWLVSYTPGWRENSVLPKKTTQCSRQWNEPDRLICLPILFSTLNMDLNMIHPVPMMKKRLFSSAIFQQGCHWPVRYASEDNINFSLSLFTVGDLPNGFPFPFYFIFRMKIFVLDEITCRRSCFTRADPNYIAVINAVVSFSGTFLFFILDLTKPGTSGTDITFHLSNGVRLWKVNILRENACETNWVKYWVNKFWSLFLWMTWPKKMYTFWDR